MAKKTVHVTQHHINLGERCKARSCPVSRALLDAGFESPSTFPSSGIFFGIDLRRKVETPESVKQFIEKFDLMLPVEPFDFEIDEDGIENIGDLT